MIDEDVGPRCNQDQVVNERGRKLIELCVQCRLRILNGRSLGDSQGYFTCHRPQGSSAVDHMLLSEEMLHRVQFFHVYEKLDLSDHCKISMMMRCKVRKPDMHDKTKLTPMPHNYKWEESSIRSYQYALTTQKSPNSYLTSWLIPVSKVNME